MTVYFLFVIKIHFNLDFSKYNVIINSSIDTGGYSK